MSKGVFVLLILVAIVAAMFIIPQDDVPLSADSTIELQEFSVAVTDTEPIYVTVVVTAPPQPTQTPQPTRRPLPTYTPYPIPTPIVEYREAPVFCYGWCGQVVLAAFAAALVVIALILREVYLYRLDTIKDINDREAEVKIAEANAQRPILTPPRDRIVPVHTNVAASTIAPDTVTFGNLTVDKGKLINFITRSLTEEIGLKIGQWKKEGWAQEDLEKLLDIMADVGLINERQVGVACTYIGTPDAAYVLRKLSTHKRA